MKHFKQLKEFKAKYPLTIAWRLKANYNVVRKHVNKDEKILYVFTGQKTHLSNDILSTAVIILTDQRILIGRKRVIFGYFYDSITPDMFNDLNLKAGLIWGKIYIDTIKEVVIIQKIQKSALYELEDVLSSYMLKYNKAHPESIAKRQEELRKKHNK